MKKYFQTFLAPAILATLLSVTITSLSQYFISKSQINQQYNQNIINKRQQLIEDAAILAVKYNGFELVWNQHVNSFNNSIEILRKVLNSNLKINLTKTQMLDDDVLNNIYKMKDYNINIVDKIKLEQYKNQDAEATARIIESTHKLYSDYLVLSSLSRIYFGESTQHCFNMATSVFNNKNDESGVSFHGGRLILDCQEDMFKELNYNLK